MYHHHSFFTLVLILNSRNSLPNYLYFKFFTARKRSLGQGNVFTRIFHYLNRVGDLCIMSFPVWLYGPMFLPRDLCAWTHVPSRESLSRWSLSREVSVQGVSLQWGLCPEGLCRGKSLSRGSLSSGVPVQGVLIQETPSRESVTSRISVQGGSRPPPLLRSGWYTSYWNAFLCCIFF